jgi:hypothetical protein
MNPQVFGTEHFIYMAVSILVALTTCILTKKLVKTPKAGDMVVKISAAILFLIIFTNRLALVYEYGEPNWQKLLTDSFCSTSSYVLSLAILFGRKNNNVLHFIWLVALAGGTITTFYPNFIGQNPSFLYPPTILGMMHHTWSAIVVVLLFMNGHLVLSYKRWRCTLFGLTCYLAYGSFLLCVLKMGNPMYMTAPAIDGTIFTVWGLLPIYIIVYSGILLVVELVRNKKGK